MAGQISWLAWQKVMVVSGNAGRNFSPLRPPCPVTITLTHLPNLLRSLLLSSLCCSSRLLLSRLALFFDSPIAFAHRSAHAFAHCFCSTLLNLAPPFCPLLCSSHSLLALLLPCAPPFCSSLLLLPFARPFRSWLHLSLSLIFLLIIGLDFTTRADSSRGK